jgi:hypothetical protein
MSPRTRIATEREPWRGKKRKRARRASGRRRRRTKNGMPECLCHPLCHVLFSLPDSCCHFSPAPRQKARFSSSQNNPAVFCQLLMFWPSPKLAGFGYLNPPLASARQHICTNAYPWYVLLRFRNGNQSHSSSPIHVHPDGNDTE